MLGDQRVDQQPTHTRPPALRRSTANRVVGGVCGGLGTYFGVDPVVFRIAFIVLTLGGWGGGVLLYLIAWLAIPEGEGEPHPVAHEGTGVRFVGYALIAVGAVALIDRFFPWFDRLVWPLGIVALGVALVVGGVNRDNTA